MNYFLEVEKNKITQQKKELHERTAVVKDMIDDASEQYRRAKAEKEYALSLNQEFNKSFISGRKWLADFIAEADKKMDDLVVRDLRYKKRPAVTASIEVADAQKQKREAIKKVKYLEYQIKTYKEHFPFLDEYEDLILNNEIDIITEEQDLPDSLNEIDRARLYLSAEEFGSLPTYERNQLALNRFLSKNHSKLMIGRMYERYIGYIYEQLGYEVEYHGIIKKFEDLGRDLICKKQNEILIIQAKCWSKSKTIHEKHIFQLYGTTIPYHIDANIQQDLIGEATTICGVFVTTTKCSQTAKKYAEFLGVKIKDNFPLDKKYPMIKCNISKRSGEKIYHLPFDQQYDKVKIEPDTGELYTHTCEEAESLGFRRAFKYHAKK